MHIHMQTTPKNRCGGVHALDLAAYRVGARYEVPATRHRPRSRFTKDYRGRADLRFTKIIVPSNIKVPAWVRSRQHLWERADDAEVRRDARIAREWIVALPRDLPRSAASKLANRIAREIADRYGCVVDLAVHDGLDRHGRPQPHVHLLCTTRRIGPDGFGDKCTIEWSEAHLVREGLASGPHQVRVMRALIAKAMNEALASARLCRRVEHQSYRSLGLSIIGSGRPKRHGMRMVPTKRQLARLRRNTSGPGVSDSERRITNSVMIARDPTAFRDALRQAGNRLTLEAIEPALGPLVPTGAIKQIAKVIVSAAFVTSADANMAPRSSNKPYEAMSFAHPIPDAPLYKGPSDGVCSRSSEAGGQIEAPGVAEHSLVPSYEPSTAVWLDVPMQDEGACDLLCELPGEDEATKRKVAECEAIEEGERMQRREKGAELLRNDRHSLRGRLDELLGRSVRMRDDKPSNK